MAIPRAGAMRDEPSAAQTLRADLAAFGAAGACVCRPFAVIGFFVRAVGLGHVDFLVSSARLSVSTMFEKADARIEAAHRRGLLRPTNDATRHSQNRNSGLRWLV